MQYMFLIYEEEKNYATLNEAQRGKMMQEYGEYTQTIVKSGHFRAGGGLKPTSTATTLRDRGGKPVPTDGPFAETKEHLGGYYLVECRDLDEALSLAARVPCVRAGGALEIRPLMEMPAPAKPAT